MVIDFDSGVWWIEDGSLHLDIPRLLERAGLPDTPQNRDLAVKVALETAEKAMPGVPRMVLRKG